LHSGIVANLVELLPSTLLFHVAFLNVCKERFSFLEKMLGVIASVFVLGFVVTAANYVSIILVSIDVFGNFAIATSLVLLAYKKTKKPLLSGYCVFFTMVIVMIVGTVASVVFELGFSMIAANLEDGVVWFLSSALFLFPVCYAVSRFIGNNLHENYVKLSSEIHDKFAMHAFILSACAYILAQINIFMYRLIEERLLLSSINVIFITTMLGIAYITMIAYSRSQQAMLEINIKDKLLKDLTDHYQHVESVYDDIRRYRHDHHQIIASIMGFADSKDPDGLRDFLSEELEYSKEVLGKLDESTGKLAYVHIPELKGLLSIKFAQALSRDIKLNLDIASPVDHIPVNRMDLSRMVGILLDNAIEELETSNQADKYLSFGILLEGSDVLIVCVNSCENPPDIGNIFNKNFTTKEPGRGLGLYNLKEMCNKNRNVLCAAYVENNKFTVILTIGKV